MYSFSSKRSVHVFDSLAKEAAALAIILAFSVFLARGLFTGESLDTGYADWINHAYRIESLHNYGFLTWTNDWGGGFPLWNHYQFAAHVVTLALRWLTGWSTTKAMVFLTGALFVLLRLVVYGGLRLSGFRVSAALVGSMLTFATSYYYAALKDFSLLWGVTLFPVVIFLLAGCGKASSRFYFAALLIGLGIYVHPIFSLLATIVLVCHVLATGGLPLRKMGGALAIVALASAFYWLPAIFADKPAYTNATVLSYRLSPSDFSIAWLGFGPSLAAVVLGALILVVRGLPLGATNPRLFSTTVGSLGVTLTIVVTAYLGVAPSQVSLAEPRRWMPFIAILFAILGALVVTSCGRKRFATLVLVTAAIIAATDGFVSAKSELPPVYTQPPASPVVQCLIEDGQASYSDRLVSISGIVPDISYYYFGKIRLLGNYFAQGAIDILYPPLMWLLLSEAEGSTLEKMDPTLALAYMRAAGGTLFIVHEDEPIAQALLPGGKLEGVFSVRHRSHGIVLFEPPEKSPQAIIISADAARDLVFPDISYDTDEQNKLRDKLVLRFSEVIGAPETIAPAVSYPRQTQIRITASGVPLGRYLIAFTPFDGGWEARVNGDARKVERAGPHYIGVDLSDLEGGVELELTHQMHWTWKAGIALAAAGVILFFALLYLASAQIMP